MLARHASCGLRRSVLTRQASARLPVAMRPRHCEKAGQRRYISTKAAVNVPIAELIVAAPPAVLAGGALIALGIAGLGWGFSVAQNAEAQPEQAAAAAAVAGPQRKPENAVLVFGAGGRLGRQVVKKLVEDGWTVVAAARDASKTQETMQQLLGEAGAKKVFVKGGVDVTNMATLTAELFEGVSKVVVATGAVFGMDKEGKMGYLDNMTSERVDKLGSENIAAAAKKFLKTSVLPEKPVVSFADKEEVAKWRRMDDVIMGGQSSSGWTVSDDGKVGIWSGDLIVEGGGFCGCRRDGLAINLKGYDGLALRVRGDGSRFKMNIKTAVNDGVSESTYQGIFETVAGEWTTVRMRFKDFVGVVRQVEDPSVPPLDASDIRSMGLVLSRFEFNGVPNFKYKPGPFKLEIESVTAFQEETPALVLLGTAAVERNARIGADYEARKKDIPIVQLNPGGALNWKLYGEMAIRFSGVPYCVVRSTGLDGGEEPCMLEFGQGDVTAGRMSRSDAAIVAAAALAEPSAVGRTVEVRRSYAPDAAGKAPDARDLRRMFLKTHADSDRTKFGLRPFPAAVPPPPPPPPEMVKAVMDREDVQNTMRRGDGGRTRAKSEASEETKVTQAGEVREALKKAAAASSGATAVAEKEEGNKNN